MLAYFPCSSTIQHAPGLRTCCRVQHLIRNTNVWAGFVAKFILGFACVYLQVCKELQCSRLYISIITKSIQLLCFTLLMHKEIKAIFTSCSPFCELSDTFHRLSLVERLLLGSADLLLQNRRDTKDKMEKKEVSGSVERSDRRGRRWSLQCQIFSNPHHQTVNDLSKMWGKALTVTLVSSVSSCLLFFLCTEQEKWRRGFPSLSFYLKNRQMVTLLLTL